MKISELNDNTAIVYDSVEEFHRILSLNPKNDVNCHSLSLYGYNCYSPKDRDGKGSTSFVKWYIDSGYTIVNSEEVTGDDVIAISETMENVKLDRPNLSFITKEKFSDFNDLDTFSDLLHDEDFETLEKALSKISELIQIAEMYFDEKKSNPESLVFQMVSRVLNDIKP